MHFGGLQKIPKKKKKKIFVKKAQILQIRVLLLPAEFVYSFHQALD